MPTRKQEKRRRKLRVHGPSADAVGAPPTGRKPPREDAPAARTPARGRREPAVPSLKRSARKGAIMGVFLVVVVFVTSRGHNSPSPLVTLLELAAASSRCSCSSTCGWPARSTRRSRAARRPASATV